MRRRGEGTAQRQIAGSTGVFAVLAQGLLGALAYPAQCTKARERAYSVLLSGRALV